VFLGTRVPLDHVAGLIQNGASEQELREDFPTLDKDDLEFARAYAKTYMPPAGAPKPLKLRVHSTTGIVELEPSFSGRSSPKSNR
jgi:uncharacterized protein DUF433